MILVITPEGVAIGDLEAALFQLPGHPIVLHIAAAEFALVGNHAALHAAVKTAITGVVQ